MTLERESQHDIRNIFTYLFNYSFVIVDPLTGLYKHFSAQSPFLNIDFISMSFYGTDEIYTKQYIILKHYFYMNETSLK